MPHVARGTHLWRSDTLKEPERRHLSPGEIEAAQVAGPARPLGVHPVDAGHHRPLFEGPSELLEAAAPLQKIVFVFAGFNERSGFIFTAKDMHFFEEQGLDAQIVQVRNGQVAVSALAIFCFRAVPGAIAQKPNVVSVWLAVNDLNATIEPASFAESLGQIVDGLVQKTGATIFVGDVPDLRAVPVYASVDKARLLAGIQAYNNAIAAIAAKNPTRVKVVDLFTGSAALVSSGTVSQDGFHPSDDGYQLIAERFASAMRANGVPLRP